MKKQIILFLLLLIAISNSNFGVGLVKSPFSFSTNHCYTTGTNIGGTVGVGAELILNKIVSASFAIGSIHFALEDDVDKSKFDFDIGIKIYPIEYLFFGINYGFIDYEFTEIDNTIYLLDFNKIRGFSFSIGGRANISKNIFLSAFVGMTNNDNANTYKSLSGGESFFPRYGVLLGYSF